VALPPPLIVLAGSTATGKTTLSLNLAEDLRARGIAAEIISADSRQVYRGMDIGTAKVTAEERARVPHHGLDLVDPDQPFSVADFQICASEALASVSERGVVAILVGGTGFYLRAVAAGIPVDDLPWQPAVRAELDGRLAAEGLRPLVAELRSLAPSRASAIDLKNPRRVVRALEIARLRGDQPLPEPRGYGRAVLWLGLRAEPGVLRERIWARARAQFDAGLVEETAGLISRFDPSARSFSGIGYAEAIAVLQGRVTREDAIVEDARRNVAFARRQATWFRRETEIEWLDASAPMPLAKALEAARNYLGTEPPSQAG
jgi:tRNA dimethylallyltransferase